MSKFSSSFFGFSGHFVLFSSASQNNRLCIPVIPFHDQQQKQATITHNCPSTRSELYTFYIVNIKTTCTNNYAAIHYYACCIQIKNCKPSGTQMCDSHSNIQNKMLKKVKTTQITSAVCNAKQRDKEVWRIQKGLTRHNASFKEVWPQQSINTISLWLRPTASTQQVAT